MPHIIEVAQHHFFVGHTRAEMDAYFAELDELVGPVSHPRPHYWERDVTEQDRCPWGYTWFVEKDGRLEQYQAHWNSSG